MRSIGYRCSRFFHVVLSLFQPAARRACAINVRSTALLMCISQHFCGYSATLNETYCKLEHYRGDEGCPLNRPKVVGYGIGFVHRERINAGSEFF